MFVSIVFNPHYKYWNFNIITNEMLGVMVVIQDWKKKKKAQMWLFYFLKLKWLLLNLFFLEMGREGERERNINVWMPLTCLQLEIYAATQTCALTGNWTGNLLVCSPALNPLSHTSWAWTFSLNKQITKAVRQWPNNKDIINYKYGY